MTSPVDKVKFISPLGEVYSDKPAFSDVLEQAKTLYIPTAKTANYQNLRTAKVSVSQQGAWTESGDAQGSYVLAQTYRTEDLQGTPTLAKLNQLGVSFGKNGTFANGVVFQGAAKIGNNVALEPHARIGRRVIIGDGVTVHPFALVGDNVQIGQGVGLGYGSVLGFGAVVDSGVIIPAGVEVPAQAHVTKDSIFVNGGSTRSISQSNSRMSARATPRANSQGKTNVDNLGSLPPVYLPYQPPSHSDEFYTHITSGLESFLDYQGNLQGSFQENLNANLQESPQEYLPSQKQSKFWN